MYFFHQKSNTTTLERGFTLIELMVSVSIFSIVLMMALGTMLTILDSNRKARTLTEVMNNINFSLENITRSMKTGVEPGVDNDTLFVTAIILEEDVAGRRFKRELIEYQLQADASGRGSIMRRDGDAPNPWIPITSDAVDIKKFNFIVSGRDDFNQPRTQVIVEGDVSVNDKISSSFVLQTSVSQRKLNLEDSEGL